jgi:hypothetical protein
MNTATFRGGPCGSGAGASAFCAGVGDVGISAQAPWSPPRAAAITNSVIVVIIAIISKPLPFSGKILTIKPCKRRQFVIISIIGIQTVGYRFHKTTPTQNACFAFQYV